MRAVRGLLGTRPMKTLAVLLILSSSGPALLPRSDESFTHGPDPVYPSTHNMVLGTAVITDLATLGLAACGFGELAVYLASPLTSAPLGGGLYHSGNANVPAGLLIGAAVMLGVNIGLHIVAAKL
jgi:hypothetical protein